MVILLFGEAPLKTRRNFWKFGWTSQDRAFTKFDDFRLDTLERLLLRGGGALTAKPSGFSTRSST